MIYRSLALILIASAGYAQMYEARALGVDSGFAASIATGINNRATVIGYSFNGSYRVPFRYNVQTNTKTLLPTFGGSAFPTAINDSGTIVGVAQRSGNALTRAVAWRYGAISDLGGPATLNEEALAVNNAGYIAGRESASNGTGQAQAYVNGQSTPLPYHLITPPSGYAYIYSATGVNSSNIVVGSLQFSSTSVWGMVYYPNLQKWYRIRSLTPNPAFPGLELVTRPAAINYNGEITGTAGINGGLMHAFHSRNWFEPTRDLGTLDPSNPNAFSVGIAINKSGSIVGLSQKGAGLAAFLWDGSTMIDLNTRLTNPTGWELLEASAINDYGCIAGTGRLNGQQQAFVLIPRNPNSPVYRPPCGPWVVSKAAEADLDITAAEPE